VENARQRGDDGEADAEQMVQPWERALSRDESARSRPLTQEQRKRAENDLRRIRELQDAARRDRPGRGATDELQKAESIAPQPRQSGRARFDRPDQPGNVLKPPRRIAPDATAPVERPERRELNPPQPPLDSGANPNRVPDRGERVPRGEPPRSNELRKPDQPPPAPEQSVRDRNESPAVRPNDRRQQGTERADPRSDRSDQEPSGRASREGSGERSAKQRSAKPDSPEKPKQNKDDD
jgi:hypothetical protein